MGTRNRQRGKVTARSSKLRLEPQSAALGATVRGISLRPDLDTGAVERIRAALEEYLVLFFENQQLTALEQRDIAAQFGSLWVHPFYPGHADAPEVMILEHDADRRAKSDRWHADATYLSNPPQASILYAEILPDIGGDTVWANMYQAYETLSQHLQQALLGLRAVHSFAQSFTPDRFGGDHAGSIDHIYATHPPVSHPVVRTNRTTGRRALFVNQDFTSHIEGVSAKESEALLRFLFEHLAQPEFQIRWRWKPNTVAFWDNRWTQHYALADYYPRFRRMRRATITGDEPI